MNDLLYIISFAFLLINAEGSSIKKCGPNEELGQLDVCALTCRNRADPDDLCVPSSTPACHCSSGFVLDENRKRCVREQDCSEAPICRENNFEFRECGSRCTTCKNPKPEVCTQECIKGCVCRDGYFYDEKEHRCVTEENCSEGPAWEAWVANVLGGKPGPEESGESEESEWEDCPEIDSW